MEYLELEEVAALLKLSVATVKGWLRSKKGGRDFWKYCTKVGKRNVITTTNLERWMHDTKSGVSK